MATPNITEMGIIPMLAAVLEGEISENSGPSQEIRPEEKQRGIITSPTARRLFTAHSILAQYMGDIVKDHGRLHEDKDKEQPAKHDCEAVWNKVSHLNARKDVLHGLLWQAIEEEHPQVVANNNAIIRKGWLLVEDGDEWNDIIPVPDKSTLANNLISHVTDIVCGRRLVVKEDGLDPVSQGEEVVGSLDDERVQTLRSLATKVRDELLSQLPPGAMDFDFKMIHEMGTNEVDRLHVLVTHYKKLCGLTSSLFWCGVRDAVPAASDLPNIGIRQNWDIVKCIPKEDEEGIKVVMTPMGPAIAMRIPIPGDLMGALTGRTK